MTADLDTYRTALDYLERHGDTAPIFAAMEADRLLDAGDLGGDNDGVACERLK